MDIKSKSYKSKYIVTVIVLIMALTASIVVMSTYSSIEKEANKVNYNPYESWDFLENIYTGNYVLFQSILEKKNDEVKIPSESLLSQKSIDYMVEKKMNSESYYNEYDEYDEARAKEEYISDIKRDFNNTFSGWQDSLFSLQNLEYFAIDKESNTTVTNTTEELNLFYNSLIKKEEDTTSKENKVEENTSSIDQTARKEELDVLKKNYSFYAVIDFDADGNMNILDSFGIEQKKLEKMFINKNQSINEYKIEPVKNTTLVYAVPSELKYQDEIYWDIRNQNRYGYYNASDVVVGVVSLGFALVSLVFPYKNGKHLLGFEKISKILLEINALVIGFIFTFLIANSAELIRMSVNREFVDGLMSTGLGIDLAVIGVNAINILYWVAYFVLIFIVITLVKHIFSVGLRKYFVSNTIIGKIFVRGINISKKGLGALKETDFREKPNKIILIAVLTNFIILTVISSLWFFGIILALVYTVVLFVLIKKNYRQIVDKYNKLLKYTNEIADGNLNANVDEDLGVFEPIKDKLGSIQTGFKKAVEEEVKSQGMKTELISNVSHDLKTPLTSIITYVDLLKDDTIDDKKRKQYIDTLDRKSQRLKVLIEDLFEMSKASSGNINLNIVDVDIVSLMKQTLLELRDQTSKSSLVFKNSFPENKVMLPLDSQRTFRIFENLIINVSKYSMPNSRVYIDIVDNESSVDIIIKNMSAVEIDFDVNDIVERFVRGDKSRNTDGSGLGLAIAKSFVELQNGKFNIEVDGDLFKVTITFNKNNY